MLFRSPADAYGVPFSNANVDLLTDPIGDDGYATKGGFLPDGVSFNNHYPFKDEISDFLVYELGAFGDSEFVNNYDADVGTVSSDSKPGEQKEYGVSYTGFSKLHFDVIGQVTNKQGRTDWKINPGSHDASAVPEPCTMLLLGTGLAGFAGTRIRKRFKK